MISYTSPLTIKVTIPVHNTNDGVFYTLVKSDLVFNFNFNFNIDPLKSDSNLNLTPILKLKLKLNKNYEVMNVDIFPYFGVGSDLVTVVAD